MEIGKFKLKNNLILAPMAGYTNCAFRALCVKFGADFAVTEMVSAKALTLGSKKTEKLLETDPCEKIKVVQLFGSEPQVFAKALKLNCLKKFDIINLNMGCPAGKIIKNNEGASLMKNLPLAREIIKACVRATDKPITVKFRLGFDSNNAVEFAKMCEETGASAIFVHGRLACDGYAGVADYDAIAAVKKSVKIPVVANGDVVDKKSYQQILQKTGADAVMIGRGAVGRPWIFKELSGKNFENINIKSVIKKHINLLKKHGQLNVNEFKKHLLAYFKGQPDAKEIKNKIILIKNEKDLENLIF